MFQQAGRHPDANRPADVRKSSRPGDAEVRGQKWGRSGAHGARRKCGDPVIAPAPADQASVAGTRGLWSKLAWPLLLACGFLIFVSPSSIYLVVASQSSHEMMNRALQLENKLWGIIAFVRVAESEQRGYLLTGNPDYLEIYRNRISAGTAAVADVKMAVADNPVQQRALA